MGRVLAVTVLVLVQTMPLLCRRLSLHHPADGPSDDRANTHLLHREGLVDDRAGLADGHVGLSEDRKKLLNLETTTVSDEHRSVERNGYISTPLDDNSPVLGRFLYPSSATGLSLYESDRYLDPEPPRDLLPLLLFPPSSSTVTLNGIEQELATNWMPQPAHKHLRKISVNKLFNEKGEIWTKFPHKNHLIEIVPIRHKNKLVKGKNKALAYILPKPNIAKQKLIKQKAINGIFIDKPIPGLHHIDFESSEENSSVDTSSDPRDSSEISDSSESSSSEYGYQQNFNSSSGHHSVWAPAYHTNVNYNEHSLEDIVDDKIDDIVYYFKESNDETDDDEIIHDFPPDSTAVSDYHAHYIIHKKHNPHENVHYPTHNHTTRTHHNAINDLIPEVDPEYNADPTTHVVIESDLINPLAHKKLEDSSDDIDKRDLNEVLHQPHEAAFHPHNLIDEADVPYDNILNKIQLDANLLKILHTMHNHEKAPEHHTHNIKEKELSPAYIHNSVISSINDEIPFNEHHKSNHGDSNSNYANIYSIIREIGSSPDYNPVIPIAPHHDNHIHAPANNGDDLISIFEKEQSILSKNQSISSNSVMWSSSFSKEPIVDTSASIMESESTSSSAESEASSSESNQVITNDEHPRGIAASGEPHVIDYYSNNITSEHVLPRVYLHALDEHVFSEESSSEGVRIEHVEKPRDGEHSPEVSLSDIVGHALKSSLNSFKLMKHKVNEHSVGCKRQKSYKLTFLFNRR